MAGTQEGAVKASTIIKRKHGEDFYKRIGSMGGKLGGGKGGFNDRALASRAGKIGGKMGGKRSRKRRSNV